MILLNSNDSLELVKIYPSNLEDNDFKAFFLALTDCKFAVRYNSLILFDFGDSPNLPATSKKAALPSRVRARFGCLLACPYVLRTLFPHARAFCQPARAGLALLQKSAIFGRGPNLQQSREYPEKAGFTGEG
ncbi:hypothetical protein K3K50_003432 [Salmonella enterica subsp. enterica serovar Manchester]|nr:hypothetical protein [Salmonella enterica subsp. enterica serovar Manchester]